jgi:hypothetical protein
MDAGMQDVAAPRTEPIDVREAVRIAGQYMRDLYQGENLPNFRLEEVELSDDNLEWRITFGFTASEKDVETNSFTTALGSTSRPRRDYKLIRVNARTGKALSMSIRTL